MLDGTATRTRTTQSPPAALKFKETLFWGDRITTTRHSLVRMLLLDKSVLTMHELTGLTITQEGTILTLALRSGKITYAVARERMQPSDIHEIRTPNATARLSGTVVIVEVEPRSAEGDGAPVVAVTKICTRNGAVFASVVGSPPVQLGPNQGITIRGNLLGPIRRCPAP